VARVHRTVRLLDGRVLVLGAARGDALNRYGHWRPPAGEPTPNELHEPGDHATAIYDPTSAAWRPGGKMRTARTASSMSVTLLPDGRVLVAGGRSPDGEFLNSVEAYDPARDTWRTVGSLRMARAHHGAVLLSDHRVLVTGGRGDNSLSNMVQVWLAEGGPLGVPIFLSADLALTGVESIKVPGYRPRVP
jgi:hypothetical protein